MSAVLVPEPASYDQIAPYYDRFTAGYKYERWLTRIEERAKSLGLNGLRALDVACGTGKSTGPLLNRGYRVMACDISPAMIDEARRKFPDAADAFFVADMRRLPRLGQFDFVLCLDDALNYLLCREELGAAFSRIAACLAPEGIFAFDLNSLRTYRTSFVQTHVKEADGTFFAWKGEASEGMGAGELASARVEIFSQRSDGLWERSLMRHLQRHHPPEEVQHVLRLAGLECCLVLGQRRGAEMVETFDEERDIKLLYFARHSRECAASSRASLAGGWPLDAPDTGGQPRSLEPARGCPGPAS